MEKDLSNLSSIENNSIGRDAIVGNIQGKLMDGQLRGSNLELSSLETLKYWSQMGLQSQYIDEVKKFWYWAKTAPFRLQMREVSNTRALKANDFSASSSDMEADFSNDAE